MQISMQNGKGLWPSMFFKRLLTQCIMLAGPVLFFLLNQLACIPLGTALIFGILLSAAGWVYGAIALRCPFCHHLYARVLHRLLSLVRRKIIAKTRNVPCCRYVPSFTLSSFKNDPASRLFASFVVDISCFR